MIKRYYKCEACGFECWEKDLSTKLEFHSEVKGCERLNCCPMCMSEEVYEIDPPEQLWECLDCEKVFLESDMPAWADAYVCPFCGSENVKEADEDD